MWRRVLINKTVYMDNAHMYIRIQDNTKLNQTYRIFIYILDYPTRRTAHHTEDFNTFDEAVSVLNEKIELVWIRYMWKHGLEKYYQ